MTIRRADFQEPSCELRKNGEVVGLTDRHYPISGDKVTFAQVIVKGDLSGDLEYNGKRLRIVRTERAIGLKVTQAGAIGPVWEIVQCEVL